MSSQPEDAIATLEGADLLMRCRHCYQRAYKVGDRYVQKVRCRRCPVCGAAILGLGSISGGIATNGTGFWVRTDTCIGQ